MKKLIAIAIVFALAASAAFADTAIGGNITVRAKVVDHTLAPGNQPTMSTGQVETAYIQLSATNDDGDMGALFRFRGNDGLGVFHRAYIWWKPVESFEIFFGQDLDGKFAFYNPWSYNQGEEGYAHTNDDWGKWRAALAFTNWDTFGLAFTAKPIDDLEVTLVLPYGGRAINNDVSNSSSGGTSPAGWEGPYPLSVQLRNQWGGSLQLTANYSIDGIGKVHFGYKMPGSNMFAEGYTGHKGTIGLAFDLFAVDGLGLLVGFSTRLPGEGVAEDQPINLALVGSYNINDDFGIRARVRFSLNGNGEFTYVKDGSVFAFGILPFYNLGFLTAYCDIGMESTKNAAGVTTTSFSINPYIRKGLGAGSIRAGVIFRDPNLDLDDNAVIQIPIVFGFNF